VKPTGVNFYDLCSTRNFCACRFQKHKKDSQVVSLYALSGSACAKAAHRTLMKLTPGRFVHETSKPKIVYKSFSYKRMCYITQKERKFIWTT